MNFEKEGHEVCSMTLATKCRMTCDPIIIVGRNPKIGEAVEIEKLLDFPVPDEWLGSWTFAGWDGGQIVLERPF